MIKMMQKPLYSFAVVSDVHIMTWVESEAPVRTVPAIEFAFRDIARQSPDFLVINGDLTNGKNRDLKLAMRILQQTCPYPIYYTFGNHEYYGFHEDPDFSCTKAQRQFLEFTGQAKMYDTMTRDDSTFVFLSTEHYDLDLRDRGWISETQLAWFRDTLHSIPANHTVFVFFHQPVNGTVADSHDTLVQSEELREILESRPNVFFFTGHTHCKMDQNSQIAIQNGVRYIGGAALTPSEKGDPQTRFVDVFDTDVRLRVRDNLRQAWIDEYTQRFAR
jgi:3',5'-cyclic-AMP phosphodiesterase